jgi:ATP-dependent Clp protease ATP-binding subunit ClpC
MNKYSEEVRIALKQSEMEMLNMCHPYVGSEHLLLAILSFNNSIKMVLNTHNITYKKFKKELINKVGTSNRRSEFIFYTPLLKRIIETASLNAKENSNIEIQLFHLVLALIEESEGIGITILKVMKCNLDQLYKDISKIINNKNLLIYELGINLNDLAKANELDKVVGRNKEIERVIEILARKNKNNPILIGEAGVGKTAIVEELSRRIVKGNVPYFLLDKKIISLNLANVISGTKYRGEFEEKLGKIIKELEFSQNIILFIDEVHTLIGAGGAEGAIDASNILKPVLSRGKVKCIGATTINEYSKYIEKDKALDRRFQKILIEEPTIEETKNILLKIKKDYEKFHNVKISDEIINYIVEHGKRYVLDRKEPDKSIDILDEVCAKTNVNINNSEISIIKEKLKIKSKQKNKYIKNNDFELASKIKEEENELKMNLMKLKEKLNKRIVTQDIVKSVIESRTNVKINDDDDKDYYKLKEKLNSEIIGQEEAINELVNITKIIKNIKDNKPISILFSGSTGVGKTELAKIYAKFQNLNLIKLDMSEYKGEMSLNRILGSPQGYIGYEDVNTAFEMIKTKPNSVVLLDEIDKAHPSIINLFYSILDDGEIKNSKGEILKFYNSIFILTTNNLCKDTFIGFNKNEFNLDYESLPKEFLNRISYIINFKNLTKNDIKKIIKKEYNKLQNDYNIESKLSNEDISKIAIESNYEIYGARKIKNIIKRNIESKLIKS